MSAKLDQLISFSENIDARSNHLIGSIHESNHLINDIMSLHNDITTADMTIESMSDLISGNYNYLNEFENLYEKSFLLESNIHLNDIVTSETTLDNLHQEYRFLMKRFTSNKHYLLSNNIPSILASSETTRLTHIQTPPKLHNAISVSNLKLKPIRCRSKKMDKKRSNYRFASTSTVKQMPNIDLLLAIPDESESDSISSINKRHLTNEFIKTPQAKNTRLASNDITNSTQSPPSKLMDTHKNTLEGESNTIFTSPDLFGELHSKIKARSNSLPVTPHLDKFELNEFHISKFNTNKNSTNIFQKSNRADNDTESETQKLRLNRLKHFISYRFQNLQLDGESTSPTPPPQDQRIEKSIFDKTPTFTPIKTEDSDIDHFDIENISTYSDISNFSPEQPQEDFENFEKYLRKSRIDLMNSIPNIIKKSNSHDSVFSNTEHIPISTPFKFHNPIENIKLNSLKIATTAVEPIYHHGNETTPSYKQEHKHKEDPSKLLNDVILKSDKVESSQSVAPNSNSKIKKTLFNLNLTSPYKSANSVMRHGSLDHVSKSFSDSVLDLVNNNSIDKSKKPEPISIPRTFKRSLTAKASPIAISSDSHIKRMPPRRDGAHSNLIIGPNKTKIISHGDLSVFSRPLMSKLSRNSLNEALNENII